MRDFEPYNYSLSLTSQFPFCGLPLRLDTYSQCQFACRYCFAAARGGNTSVSKIQLAPMLSFSRRLERIARGIVASPVDELLARRIPIHLGGMSDPFPPLEKELEVTYEHLKAARDHRFPVLMSTKSTLVSDDRYLEILASGPFAVQMSIPTIDDKLAKAVDAGAPLPSERIEAIRTLSSVGVPVACRIQPVLPGRESEVFELIDAVATAGARQIAVEHMKLPVEREWIHRKALNSSLGMDLLEYFASAGAARVGREWILPVTARLPAVLRYRRFAHERGIYFGAADNDLLHLSDGNVCCSGADLLGLGKGFTHNYLSAVRLRNKNNEIRFAAIGQEWTPSGSIKRYINSRSRPVGSTVGEFIATNWNGRPNGSSPALFYGVEPTEALDGLGMRIYQLRKDVADLIDSEGE